MKRFSNILAVVNTGRKDTSALQRAVSLANSNLAALTIVSVLEELPGDMRMSVFVVTLDEIRDRAAMQELDRLDGLDSVVERKGEDIENKILTRRPFLEVIRRVLGSKHDLVIKNVEPSEEVSDKSIGSLDMHLLRKCPCPVWLIKPGHKHIRRILVCVDFDPDSTVNGDLNRQMIEMATLLAAEGSGELHIINAMEKFGDRFFKYTSIAHMIVESESVVDEDLKLRRQWLEMLRDEQFEAIKKAGAIPPIVHLHLEKDRAQNAIPVKARKLDVDLIIMGTLARTGIQGYFMSNTSESILNQVPCSVLTMKPPGFVSPVTL